MEESQPQLNEPVPTPPKDSHWSTILNGAGNGAAIGAVPLALLELYKQLTDKNVSRKTKYTMGGLAILSGIGAGVGAVMGAREARRLEEYRLSANDRLTQLTTQVTTNTGTIKRWSEKLEGEKAPTEAALAR